MGDPSIEVTKEQQDSTQATKGKAMEAMSNSINSFLIESLEWLSYIISGRVSHRLPFAFVLILEFLK